MLLKWFERRVDPYPSENLNKPLPKDFFPFVWQCAAGLKHYLIMLVLLTAATASFEALFFSQIGHLVDWLSQSHPNSFFQEHARQLLMLVGILAANIMFATMQSIIRHQILFSSFPMRLRWRFHNLMMQQSLDFFSNEFSGRLAAKIMQTALAVREFWVILGDILAYVIIYFISVSLMLGNVAPSLLIPLFVWLGLFVLAATFFVPRMIQISKKQADARAVMTGRITDAYTNIQTVKLFAHTQRESQFAKTSMQEFMVTVYTQMRLATLFELSLKLLSAVLFIGVLGTAVYLWTLGQVELGIIAATTAMILKLNSLSEFVMWQISMLFENIGTIQDGKNTLAQPVSIVDIENAQPLQLKQGGHIEFKDVCFSYNQNRNVIDHFNLNIQPGEKIGIVGRSGAGKSTLIQLLLHFYDIQKGTIEIDGQNIAEVTQDSLRQHIALVTQDTSLLHRTVSDNIRYGRNDATNEEFDYAIEKAKVKEFIENLSDVRGNKGLDAYVGERGVKLSGGQRQRIAIARVFLKDAPILILDEATSALDSEVEAAIQSSLNDLMAGKTVIAIAHRLSTIAKMDRIVVLDQGKIVEQGSHTELLELHGIYAQLWQRQTGGFLVD